MPGPIIDMTPEGEFRPEAGTAFSVKILRVAIMVAALAGALALAAFALWIALLLIPVAVGAAAIAWLAWRWRMWQRSRYSAASGIPAARRAAAPSRV